MLKICYYKSVNNIVRFNHLIHNDQNPNIKSPSALILLNEDLKIMDSDYDAESILIKKQLEFYKLAKLNFFKKHKDSKNKVNCTCCNKNLIIPHKLKNTLKKSQQAHIFHINDVEFEYLDLDETNWKIVCLNCFSNFTRVRKNKNSHIIKNNKTTSFIQNIENPNIKSPSALILLNYSYKLVDIDFLNRTDSIQHYLNLRDEFLNNILKENGDLVCIYCGKPHLEIGERLASLSYVNNKNSNLATIDHKIPRSENLIDPLDTTNWLVACKKCNKKKGSNDHDSFVKTVKPYTQKK